MLTIHSRTLIDEITSVSSVNYMYFFRLFHRSNKNLFFPSFLSFLFCPFEKKIYPNDDTLSFTLIAKQYTIMLRCYVCCSYGEYSLDILALCLFLFLSNIDFMMIKPFFFVLKEREKKFFPSNKFFFRHVISSQYTHLLSSIKIKPTYYFTQLLSLSRLKR